MSETELLKEPKFKKTPKERKQDKAFGKDPTDLGLPMMGLMSMGATAAASAAYDKGKKLDKDYKAAEKEGFTHTNKAKDFNEEGETYEKK